VVEDLKKINDNLSAENMSLRSQVLCKSYILL
jgi:hypothetical protein